MNIHNNLIILRERNRTSVTKKLMVAKNK